MVNQKLQQRLKVAIERFRSLYGDGDVTVLRAPARINILGEHVDYVSYLPTASLPFGSREHEMLMLFRTSSDGCVRGASMNEPFAPFEFALGNEAIPEQTAQSWESYVFDRPAPAPHWANYVKGAVSFARWKYGPDVKQGFSFFVDSTIPASSGASSSSALVVLAGAVIRQVNGIGYQLDELARDSSKAEWYLGTRGGALDHTAICMARAGHIVHIRHWNGQIEWIPFPNDNYRWITFFTHAAPKGSEVMLEYNERAAVSRLIIPAWRAEMKEELPKTVTLDEVARCLPQAFRECERAFPALVKERRTEPLKLGPRFEHHAGEIILVKTAIAAFTETAQPVDLRMRTLGVLLNSSHKSLRDNYEVSTPEVEHLVEILLRDPDVYGARLMGGGFGGNVLALTPAENAHEVINRVQADFYSPRGRNGISEGSVMVSTPGDGLSAVDLPGS